MQVVSYASRQYKASILEFQCELDTANLAISKNKVIRNNFIGADSTFFYINGGIASVLDNNFSYNGKLSNEIQSNVAATYKR